MLLTEQPVVMPLEEGIIIFIRKPISIMILLRKKNKALLLLLFLSLQLFAQKVDLFSEKNVSEYAKYLFRTNQFSYAAEEYERLLFMNKKNESYQLGLLTSYRFSGNYSKGILAYQNFLDSNSKPSHTITIEYSKLNLLSNNFNNNNLLLRNSEIDPAFQNNLSLTMRLLSYPEYKGGLEGIDVDQVDIGLMNLYASYSELKYKSRFLSGTFSALVPGTGKVYSGRWKDGLISFLFVGATTYQAYRAFNQKGTKSAYGWIMGSLAFGFYIGNIYGSVKAAKIYNTNQNRNYSEKVTDYYINHF